MWSKPDLSERSQGIQVIKNLTILTFLAGGILAFIVWMDPYAEIDLDRHINAAIIDKQAILSKTKGRKVILVAGSNFLYGIDSDSLEKEVGLPVVNMALPYYLGSDFLLKQVEGKLQPGDIVLMGFEFIVTDEGILNEKMLTAQLYPPASSWIEYPTWQSRISAPLTSVFLRIRKMISRSFVRVDHDPTIDDTTNELFRGGIDAHGDLVSQDNNPSTGGDPKIPMNTEKDFLPVIACMDRMAKKHTDVHFLYVYPTLSQSGYDTDQQVIQKIQTRLDQGSHSFQLINSLADSVYPDSLFHNSPYHLTPIGRTMHTKRLAEWIKRTL